MNEWILLIIIIIFKYPGKDFFNLSDHLSSSYKSNQENLMLLQSLVSDDLSEDSFESGNHVGPQLLILIVPLLYQNPYYISLCVLLIRRGVLQNVGEQLDHKLSDSKRSIICTLNYDS